MTNWQDSGDASERATTHDIIYVGGGLASCLSAVRLSQTKPHARILILEAGTTLVDNKTWSFHKTDISAAQFQWVSPFVTKTWPASKVRFPKYERTLETPYCSIASDDLRQVVETTPGIDALTGARVAQLSENLVSLADGREFSAPAVIDGRGFAPSPHLNLGYQKFIGQEIVLKEPHGETLPTIMDASVSQLDGYRFVYVLPFDEKTVLVEDTRYTDEADLDEGDYRTGISRYIGERGWRIERVEREETGILPVVLAFDGLKFWNERKESAAPIGLRAALFHPTTGYSFPDAVQTADLIADMPQLTSEALREQLRRYGLQQWGDHRFFRLLNRMLFKAAEPEQRYKVLERFYRLSQRLIERFYAGRLRETDKARILFGKPPVPITRAVKVLSPNSIKSTNERNSYVGT